MKAALQFPRDHLAHTLQNLSQVDRSIKEAFLRAFINYPVSLLKISNVTKLLAAFAGVI